MKPKWLAIVFMFSVCVHAQTQECRFSGFSMVQGSERLEFSVSQTNTYCGLEFAARLQPDYWHSTGVFWNLLATERTNSFDMSQVNWEMFLVTGGGTGYFRLRCSTNGLQPTITTNRIVFRNDSSTAVTNLGLSVTGNHGGEQAISIPSLAVREETLGYDFAMADPVGAISMNWGTFAGGYTQNDTARGLVFEWRFLGEPRLYTRTVRITDDSFTVE